MASQSDITAGGHVAGRDLTVVNSPAAPADRVLEALYARYRAELSASIATSAKLAQEHSAKIIDELNSFFVSHDLELKSLEEKLSDPKLHPLLHQARIFKQQFRQALERFLYYPSAQRIYSYLLGEVSSSFHLHIVPLLSRGTDLDVIMEAIDTKIVEPIQQSLPDCEPTCNKDTLLGMIYFLTGNCFISWSEC